MEATKTKIISYLTFNLGKEHFALNVGKVVNILEMQEITKIPQAPDHFPGIINLRGEVLPVIDTNAKLGLGFTEKTGNTCILVIDAEIEGEQTKFGIIVDSVQEVLQLEDEQILAPPTLGDKYRSQLITGVVQREARFIMIIDINSLLDFNDVLDIQNISNAY